MPKKDERSAKGRKIVIFIEISVNVDAGKLVLNVSLGRALAHLSNLPPSVTAWRVSPENSRTCLSLPSCEDCGDIESID